MIHSQMAIVVGLCTLVLLTPAGPNAGTAKPVGGPVEASQFIIRDGNGVKRGVIGCAPTSALAGFESEVGIQLFDSDGHSRLEVMYGKGGAIAGSLIVINDAKGRPQASLSASDNGKIMLQLGDQASGQCISGLCDPTAGVGFTMSDTGTGRSDASPVRADAGRLPRLSMKGGAQTLDLGNLNLPSGPSGLQIQQTGSTESSLFAGVAASGESMVFGSYGNAASPRGFELKAKAESSRLVIRTRDGEQGVSLPAQH